MLDNDGKLRVRNFKQEISDVAAGRYVLQGHPNPTTPRQRTDPKIVELKSGKVVKISFLAK